MKIRKLFIISPIGLVLLVWLVLVWWYLGDDAWIKGKVEETVSEMTGRSLSIDGPFSIDWSTSPVLLAENIHFSNPSWTVHEDLVGLDRLELSVDLFSLFKDQTRIAYIKVDGLVVALEQRIHGPDDASFENSWKIKSLQPEADAAVAEPGTPLPVSIERISLTDFTLLHEAPDRTVPFDFQLEQLQLIQGADQQLQISTDGRLGGEQIEVNGNLGPLAEFVMGGKTRHDIRLALGDIKLLSKGSIEQTSTFSGANIKVNFSGPEFEWLLAQFAMPQFSHASALYQLRTLTLETGGNRVLVSGQMGDWPQLADTGLDISISGPDLRSWESALGTRMLPDTDFKLSGRLDRVGTQPANIDTHLGLGDSRLQGSPSVFHARKIEIELGASDLSGELSVNLEDKPDIKGVFKSNYLDLAWLEDNNPDENEEAEPASDSPDQGEEEYLIPDSPITFSPMDMANIDLEVSVNEINFSHRVSHDVRVHAKVIDGNLFLDPFQTRGEDGDLLSGSLAVERDTGSEDTSIDLFLEGNGVKLGIGTVKGQDPDTMRTTDIVAKLTGKGITYRDLARSLNGHVEVVQGAGLTESSGLGLIFGNVIREVLDMLNPFSKTEKFTANECAVIVANIESGVITIDPVVSQTDKMTVVAKGGIDLNTEMINFTFNTKLRKGIGLSASMVVNPFIGVTGTLKSPTIGLDPAAVAVTGTVAVATVGISLLVRSLSDRYFSSKDPCGDALTESRKQMSPSKTEKKNKK